MKTIDLICLYERGSPAQKLWAVVLLLAVKDGATTVCYDPAQGEKQLSYEIGGIEYALAPPPEHLKTLLPKVVGNWLCKRSAWRLISWLFASSASQLVPMEGMFAAVFNGQRVIVSAAVDKESSRVVFRLFPETSAVPAARNALEFVLRKTPEVDLRELPE